MKAQATELQIFAGGINAVPASHLIKQEEAIVSANTNLRKLNLSPLLSSLFYEEATDNYTYHFNGEFRYFDKFRSNILYNEVWYWSDIANTGKQYEDGRAMRLGIAPPSTRLTITSQAPSAGDGLTGNINYVYTYYDPLSGSESPPSPPSITLDLLGAEAGKAIVISDIIPSPEGYETRLYRIGGIITAYSAVVTVPDSTLSYVDQLSFSEIQAIILDTLRAYPPPAGLQHLTQHQGRFYGSVGSKLYFSAAGKPDSWYALDFIGFDDVVKGIVSVANGLIVMTIDKAWTITGISPIQFVKHTLSDSEGCIGFASIAVNSGTAVWLSGSGFVMSNGSSVQNISIDKMGRFEALTPLGAAFVDKRYFLAFVGALFPSDELLPSEELVPGTEVTSGELSLPPGAIIIDFTFGAPAISTMLDDSLGQLLVVNNDLYNVEHFTPTTANIATEDRQFNLVTEDGLKNIVAGVSTGKSIVKTLRGKELRELTYLSPVLTEGSIGTLKTYEKVRLTYSGTVTINVFDEDSKLFISKTLTSVKRVTEWIGIPVVFNRGYGIQFSLKGKAIVDSLLYTWSPKEAQ